MEWVIPELLSVTGDLAFLQIALRNLFSNAVKYTRTRESAKIELSVNSTVDEYIVSVRNNGVGFNMKYVNKLFGVFQRAASRGRVRRHRHWLGERTSHHRAA